MAEAGLLASIPLSRVEISTLSSTITNMAMPLNMMDLIIMDNGLDLFKIPQKGSVKKKAAYSSNDSLVGSYHTGVVVCQFKFEYADCWIS